MGGHFGAQRPAQVLGQRQNVVADRLARTI
jgi:hypothetical protein